MALTRPSDATRQYEQLSEALKGNEIEPNDAIDLLNGMVSKGQIGPYKARPCRQAALTYSPHTHTALLHTHCEWSASRASSPKVCFTQSESALTTLESLHPHAPGSTTRST